MLAVLQDNDLILCQITSQTRFDAYSVTLEAADFTTGGLTQSSRVRPGRLFTAEDELVLYRAGQITSAKLGEVVDRLIAIFTRP